MTKISKSLIAIIFALSVFVAMTVMSSAADGDIAGKVVTSSGNLNVRSAPSASAGIITSVGHSSWLTLKSKSGEWWHVEYKDGKYGWCHEKYIRKYDNTYQVTVSTSGSALNVRTGAGTSHQIQDKLYNGESAVVLYSGTYWSRILYHGSKIGYAHKSYLVKTSNEKISLSVPSYKQTDSRWASYPIGTTGGTIGKIGCTTTALAMTESYHSGTTITPKMMAQRLSYSSSGSLYWPSYYQVELAGSDYLKRIYSLLSQGKPVVFGAKKSNGTQHWVTVTGFNGNRENISASDFTINDPGSNTRTSLQHFLDAYPYIYKIVFRK